MRKVQDVHDHPLARMATVAWQWVVGLAAAGIGLFLAAGIGALLVAPSSAGAYALVAVTVVMATAFAGWGWDRVTGSRSGRRHPAPSDRPRR
ncbi:hypothetical protein OHB26_39605 (plasmid) [Nocardia sp. NBC_01503]|uniref:hypothetical protein n=1 Tax=Nocardia sp. NBC_01503 TaxID=2975997 RepID=UPI002E7BA4D6|nr:hypothetical protein [Nocardia sp. NBC_01503]WTL36785.1 hypothetical protein OHB26_39605 [Nocardia sp. NBC_01503]